MNRHEKQIALIQEFNFTLKKVGMHNNQGYECFELESNASVGSGASSDTSVDLYIGRQKFWEHVSKTENEAARRGYVA